MKKYQNVTKTETRTTRVCVERTCDICQVKAKDNDTAEWNGTLFEVNETEIEVKIKQKEGVNYPEYSEGTRLDVDLCPQCFKGKFLPWLKSQGAEIEEIDWGW